MFGLSPIIIIMLGLIVSGILIFGIMHLTKQNRPDILII